MCRPCRTIHRKEYREKNIEKFKEKDKKHYEKYRDIKRLQQSEYYSTNKDKIQTQRKSYREANPDAHRAYQRQYYHANLNRRLSLVYRNRVRREVKSGKNYLEYLGCSIEHLKSWFEFNFELDGFTWDNYNILWEIDHVIPCSTFDMNNKEEVCKCFNWQNTKPENKSFNKKKNNTIIPAQKLELERRILSFNKQRLLTVSELDYRDLEET